MTTHRFFQVHNLLDSVESMSRICGRAAVNAARIRNDRAAGHFLRKQTRLDRIAAACRVRMEAAQ